MRGPDEPQSGADYFRVWSVREFPRFRAYVIAVGVAAAASIIVWGSCAWYLDEPVNLWTTAKEFMLFAPAMCALIFVMRRALVTASWLIAGEALRLANLGDMKRARMLLLVRHPDISPLVVKDPVFQRLLDRVGLREATGDDPAEVAGAEAREAKHRRAANVSQIVTLAVVIGVIIFVLRLLALYF